MPTVDGKKYPYDREGRAAARRDEDDDRDRAVARPHRPAKTARPAKSARPTMAGMPNLTELIEGVIARFPNEYQAQARTLVGDLPARLQGLFPGKGARIQPVPPGGMGQFQIPEAMLAKMAQRPELQAAMAAFRPQQPVQQQAAPGAGVQGAYAGMMAPELKAGLVAQRPKTADDERLITRGGPFRR